MARLLIKAVDATHLDRTKDKRGCYKEWDVVVVAPDSHVWGRKEGLPAFYRVDIPGASVESLSWLTTTDEELPSEFIPASLAPLQATSRVLVTQRARKAVRRRRYRADFSALTFTDGLATTDSTSYANKRAGERNAI